MLYFSVSLFTAQILYVYFCIDRFRIWIIDDKSFNVADVPFLKKKKKKISLCCMGTDL